MKKGKKSTTPPNAKHSEAAKLPIPSDGTIRVRNDHMGYILTWYGIAAGIFVIFFSYHLRRPAKKRRR